MQNTSYEDKMWIRTLQELGFGYQTIAAKFPFKGVGSFVQCKQSVTALMSIRT